MAFVRLDRFISNQTGLSRSQAREALKSKSVTVNGVMQKDFDYKVDTDRDDVKINGEKVAYDEFIYLLMNKPSGVLTATEDHRQKTVLDLVPEGLRRKNLAPVGRLDKDTTGLLILTDDGVFAHNVISPKSGIEKEYIAVLDGNITDDDVVRFSQGVVLADGTKCMPAVLKKLDNCVVSIIIKEGKYHQIKRMFGTIGLGVNELKRVRIAKLSLPEDLPQGDVMKIDKNCLFAE